MTGLIAGIWKYLAIEMSEDKIAPFYVSIVHRASFMYAFATLTLSVFVYFSIFSSTVNLLAVIFPLLFFALALGAYIIEGIRNTTNNIIRDGKTPGLTKIFMLSLIVGETIGSAIVIIGFYLKVIKTY
jgi:hypothetical protein